MKEMIDYLDNLGHALGIGGFEGVLGAFIIAMAALVIVVRSLSLLRRIGTGIKVDEQRVNPLEWMEDAEKTVGVDYYSKTHNPSYDNLPGNIWYKRP